MRRMTPMQRFVRRIQVDPETGCWNVRGLNSKGYGTLALGGAHDPYTTTHRFSYELFFGPVPEGRQIDHLCRNRGCANPLHLEIVTQRVNILRGASPSAENAKKTRCKHGHESTLENTYTWRGMRHCRACGRIRQARYQKRRSA